MLAFDSVERRTKLALQKPLSQRCEDLALIFEEFPSKDLHTFFPQLLSSIFGFDSSSDWGLKKGLNVKDTEALRAFLTTGGGLFKLIDKLQADTQLRYEFFTSCLPYPTRRSLADGVIPALYVNKVQVSNSKVSTSSSVSLNAFEYFMFHFAYYIVYPQTQKESNWSGNSDVIYVAIFEEYLKAFFPADGSRINITSSIQSNSSSKLPSRPTLHRSPATWHPGMTSSSGHGHSSLPGLLRASSGSGVSKSSPHKDLTSQETFRSETLFQILIEFWFNQNSLDSMNNSYLQPGQEYFMPTIDHVRLVRVLVKHVHSFINSGGVYNNIQSLAVNATDELRRTILSQIFQKKFYYFLRHGFAHWPLDPTFRMMLETWLSYIQPWRYLGALKGDQKEAPGEKWKPFILENFLFYTELFQEFLTRAFRLDLHSSKDAQLLHRVAKVYSQPNLMEIIEEGEEVLMNPAGKTATRNASTFGTNPLNILRQHFTDLRGPTFQYYSFFSNTTLDKIKQIMQKISSTLKTYQMPETPEPGGPQHGTMAGNMLQWISNIWEPGDNNEYRSIQEEKKVGQFLTQAQSYLTNMFKLEEQSVQHKTVTWGNTSSPLATPGTSSTYLNQSATSQPKQQDPTLPDCIETENGLVLSPLGRYQIANGIRKFEVIYQGDPELQPIRSYENTTLVRMLYKFSQQLNSRFGPTLQKLYNRHDIVGSTLCYLSPSLRKPISPQHGPLSSPRSPQLRHAYHVPRLSLRFLGSYRNLGYLALFFVISWLFSVSPFLVITLVLLFLVSGVLLHVNPQHQVKQE